jgi:hypothetical protein
MCNGGILEKKCTKTPFFFIIKKKSIIFRLSVITKHRIFFINIKTGVATWQQNHETKH